MMQLGRVALALFAAVMLSTPAFSQSCAPPTGPHGALQFNADYGVLQLCTPKGWVSLHSPACPDGDGCSAVPSAPTTGLVGHWTFDESSGNIVDIISGNDAVQVGTGTVTYGISAPNGTGINLNGGTVHFRVDNAPEIQITGAITVSGWFNWNGTGATTVKYLISKRGTVTNRGYRLEFNSDQQPKEHLINAFGSAKTAV